MRPFLLIATGYLWRFHVFRWACIAFAARGWCRRTIGLYTPLWASLRSSFNESGHFDLAAKYGDIERRYQRLARVAQL